jgi:hypothetical protein
MQSRKERKSGKGLYTVRLLSRADVPCGKRLYFTLYLSFIAAYFAEGIQIA